MKYGLLAGAFCLAMGAAQAQIILSEFMINPPGSPDIGREYVEIRTHQPNMPLTNVWVIGIDGDGEFNPGNIHWAINLSSYSSGGNGLLLIRDGAAILQPAPATATTVVTINQAFTPAGMGNDSYTVAVVCGFRGQPGDDIDLNDDGVIDNPLWDFAYDSAGWIDGDSIFPGITDQQYTAQLNGTEVSTSRRTESDGFWEPDAFVRHGAGIWAAADWGRCNPPNDNNGPFCMNATNRALEGTMPEGFDRLTPGNQNPGYGPAKVGDVNGDGQVNDTDLLAVLFRFGGSVTLGCYPAEDLTFDGQINDADLLVVLFNFGS